MKEALQEYYEAVAEDIERIAKKYSIDINTAALLFTSASIAIRNELSKEKRGVRDE